MRNRRNACEYSLKSIKAMLLFTLLFSFTLIGCTRIHTRIFHSPDLTKNEEGKFEFADMIYCPIGKFESYEGFLSIISRIGGPLGIKYPEGKYGITLEFRGSTADTIDFKCDSMLFTFLPSNDRLKMPRQSKRINTRKLQWPRIYFWFGRQDIPKDADSLIVEFSVRWKAPQVDSVTIRPFKMKMLRYDKSDWVFSGVL